MDAKAIKLIDMVLQWEGGYGNVKHDAGGETYRGITRKNHPSWSGWKIVDSKKPLKYNQIIKDKSLEENVREFYYTHYYLPMKIDKMDVLLTSGQVFAMGVNAGLKTGPKLLQKAINKVYHTSIVVDGIVGKTTLSYANGGRRDEVANEVINQCNSYYDAIVARKPTQRKFLNGWKNRVKGVTKTCSSSNSVTKAISSAINSTSSKVANFASNIIKFFK